MSEDYYFLNEQLKGLKKGEKSREKVGKGKKKREEEKEEEK